jgi:hypothetical protein
MLRRLAMPTQVTIDALEALKAIYGAAEAGEPYTLAELAEMVGPILCRAYDDEGIRLSGEA